MDRIFPMGQLDTMYSALSPRSIWVHSGSYLPLVISILKQYAVSHGKMVGTSNLDRPNRETVVAVSHGKMVGTSNAL